MLDPCVQCFPTEYFVVVHPPANSSQKRTTPDLLAISQCLATHGGIEWNMYIQIFNLQLDISVSSLSIKDQPCSHIFFNINGNFRILKWRYCIRPYFVLICSYFLKPSPKCGTEVRDMPCHLERSPGGGVQATWPIQNKPKRQRSMSPGFN